MASPEIDAAEAAAPSVQPGHCAVCDHAEEQHPGGGECAESFHCGCMRFREVLGKGTKTLYEAIGVLPHRLRPRSEVGTP